MIFRGDRADLMKMTLPPARSMALRMGSVSWRSCLKEYASENGKQAERLDTRISVGRRAQDDKPMNLGSIPDVVRVQFLHVIPKDDFDV